ncbi:uncharacterized protein B0T15DRAFT_255994 [Chaetomium strumarium]|uniref:Rhodopsin domain-containing protein n=1 Tax=Chaetomium strumarium TaxID=1170767 RepID=A0AAJ0GRR4_9PEZI|nr:hypothetical protein B0T15DRAFT_255994 [Chaetomium strumarium]
MVSPEQVMAAEWCTVVLAYLLVGMRLAVRVMLKQRHLFISDLWLLLASACVLGLVTCDTLTYQKGAMSDFTMVDESLGKIRFATNYFFDAGLYLPKISMLAIYFQLLTHQGVWQRWALYFVTAFTGSSALITLFADTFWCGPEPSINWSTAPDACSTFTSITLVRINWALCITCEVLIFLLPLPAVYRIRGLATRDKAGLVLVFSLGAITMIVSTGRFITMMSKGNNISIYIWATAEFTVSIMVVACMALRPLARIVWSRTSLTGSKSHSSRPTYTGSYGHEVIRPRPHGNIFALHGLDATISEAELNRSQTVVHAPDSRCSDIELLNSVNGEAPADGLDRAG